MNPSRKICVVVSSAIHDPQVSRYELTVDNWSAGEVKLVAEGYDIMNLIDHLVTGLVDTCKVLIMPLGDNYDSDTLIGMSIAADMVKEMSGEYPDVALPYLPYSRQERATLDAPYVGLRVINKLFAGCRILTSDVHNEKGAVNELVDCELVNNTDRAVLLNLEAFMSLTGTTENPQPVIFVAPDHGAIQRTMQYAMHYSQITGCAPLFASIQKERTEFGVTSVIDEKIAGFIRNTVKTDNRTKIVVTDDICDGGRTFVNAANLINEIFDEEEKSHGGLYLMLSHGIFSSRRTLDVLNLAYDDIIVYNRVACVKGHD